MLSPRFPDSSMNHHARYGLLLRLLAVLGGAVLLPARAASAQAVLPPLPDSTGWGVHVLTAARDPQGALWVGTYSTGIYRLPSGAEG